MQITKDEESRVFVIQIAESGLKTAAKLNLASNVKILTPLINDEFLAGLHDGTLIHYKGNNQMISVNTDSNVRTVDIDFEHLPYTFEF